MIDTQTIEQLKSDVGTDLAFELLTVFINESKKTVVLMLSASLDDSLIMYAHSLKGSCQSYGAITLANTCIEIEKKAKAGEFDNELQELLHEAQTQSDLTFAQLTSLVHCHSG
jgi:HPt (histidine-containing phosphotransfer) domain-containing protein